MARDGSHYDAKYFDRWYRDPRHRVFTAAERARRVGLVLSAAEYVLQRPVRTVLDVGAGEGHWRAPLLKARPRLRYLGLDPSPYVVQRFGASRGIQLGSMETLDPLAFRGAFDLVLAVGFLNLLPPLALRPALERLRPLIGGVALLELFTDEDPISGDTREYFRAPASSYRRMFRRLGLVSIGAHLYAPQELTDNLGILERLP
jgi:SAM-dependent methyltransferase